MMEGAARSSREQAEEMCGRLNRAPIDPAPEPTFEKRDLDEWLASIRSRGGRMEESDFALFENPRAYGWCKRRAEELIPLVIDALSRPEPPIRRAAARSIGLFHWKARAALPVLFERLSRSEGEARRAFAAAIRCIDYRGETPLPIILDLGKDADPEIRRSAVEIIQVGNRRSPEAIAVLAEALGDPEFGVRLAPLSYLRKLGREAVPVLPALEKALEKEQGTGRKAIEKTARKIRRWAHRPRRARIREIAFVAAILAGAPLLVAAYLLFVAGWLLSRLVPRQWRERFRRRFHRVTLSVYLGERYGHAPVSRESIPLFLQALKEGDDLARRTSADALGMLRRRARSAIPALEAAAGDPSEEVRSAALLAIERIR